MLCIGELVQGEGWHFFWPEKDVCYLYSPGYPTKVIFTVIHSLIFGTLPKQQADWSR